MEVGKVNIMEIENLANRIRVIISQEDSRLDWLLEKRIEFLNKRVSVYDEDVFQMIILTQTSLDYYREKLIKYEKIIKKLKTN